MRLDIKISEPHPFRRKLIDVRRRRAARDAAAVNTYFTATKIIHEDEDDVGVSFLRACIVCWQQRSGERQSETEMSYPRTDHGDLSF